MLLKTISDTNLTIRTFKTLEQYIDYFHRNNPSNLDPNIIEIFQDDILFKVDEAIIKDQPNIVNLTFSYKIYRILYKKDCFWYTSLIFKEI